MRGFYRRFDRIVDLCGDVPGYLVALIAAVIFLDVASRNLGFGALGGVLEMVQYALVLLAFTGAVHVFRERRHIRVEVLVAMLPRRLRRGVELVARLVVLVVALAMTGAVTRAAALAWSDGSVIRRFLSVPEWIPLAIVALGFAMLTIEALRQVVLPGAPDDADDGEREAAQDPGRAR